MEHNNRFGVNADTMQEMDISHYLKIINRYKWSILALALLMTVLVGVIVYSMTPMYKATTKLLIESQMPKISSIEDLYGVDGQNQQYQQTQLEIIQSRHLASMVVHKLYPELAVATPVAAGSGAGQTEQQGWLSQLRTELGMEEQSLKPVDPLDERIQQLLSSVTVQPVMRTQIVDISYVSSSPEMAAKAANAFAQAYIEDQLESRIEMTQQGTSWLFDRLNVLKESLQKSEQALQQYMDSQSLVDVKGVATLAGEGLKSASERVTAAQAAFAQIQKQYGPKHPKYIQARSELTAAENALSSGRSEVRTIGRKEVRLRELQRQVDSDRQLYDLFLKRMKESSQAVDYKQANARILDTALVPATPFKPNKKRFILLAFIGGLFLGVLLAFLNESLDRTIKTSDDVEQKLGQANLGLLPKMKQAKGAGRPVFPILDPQFTGFAESIRTIRTGLVLSGLDNPHKIILVTSSVPGEGKTTVSSNLAVAMAQVEKTLLVGADMRRPSLARACGLSPDLPGLSEVVAGEVNFKDIIQVDEATGLHILPGGMIPPNPLELLSSDRFAKAIGVFEKFYDRIVIDSPPVQAVSDALVLSKYAKAVVYVIEADKTHEQIVRNGLKRLMQHDAPIAGIVLNKVDIARAEKYGYEYGGYYDHYGYSTSEK
ncbi:GumC family protein [Mariprofundus erugo]|uniref:GumC family protein n=1 Tax=Mariprofundus erugo TaxID=2528639 RepID=UPI00137607D6|nr:polysaccharide biosynthesis tyrosine autokinase [Mariprofundus erugo]